MDGYFATEADTVIDIVSEIGLSLSLSHLYPGSGVVLDCIDS